MIDPKKIRRARENYFIDTHPSEVDVHHGKPSSLRFMQDVAKHWPVLYKSAVSTEPWVVGPNACSEENVASVMGDRPVAVAVTPTGRADAIDEKSCTFALPCDVRMPVSRFLGALRAYSTGNPSVAVHYVQSQNDNLGSGDFAPLMQSQFAPPASVPFADEALRAKPDAVNLWMGDGRTVTTMHADPYENVYAVVRGAKAFTLVPPTDAALVPTVRTTVSQWGSCRLASLPKDDTRPDGAGGADPSDAPHVPTLRASDHHVTKAELELRACAPRRSLRWVIADDVAKWAATVPARERPRVYRVQLGPGDMLYLPAGWLHEVHNAPIIGLTTVAVNWWYDQPYTAAYVVERLFRRIPKAVLLRPDTLASSDSEGSTVSADSAAASDAGSATGDEDGHGTATRRICGA